LYDANGNVVTSGTDLSSPFAFAVALTPADANATKASLAFYNPQPGSPPVPGNWTGTGEAGPTRFSPASGLPAGTPADIVAFAPTYPVVATPAANISTWLASNVPSSTPGYANTIQVRLTDSGPLGAGNPANTYWEDDIGYNTTSSAITVDGTAVPANGWALLYPSSTPTVTVTNFSPATLGQGASNVGVTVTGTSFLTGATVTVPGISFSSISVVNSTTITAMATVASSAPVGAATVTVTDSVGTGSCNACLTIAAAPTVAKFSPTRLGQGASNIGVTLNGTGFLTGATPSVAGINLSSVSVVNSTTITAKAKVGLLAKLGAATVTVTDSVGSGSCTNCLTIVAAPKVKSIMPLAVAGASKSLTIIGAGFVSGAKVTGPTGVNFNKVKVVSSTRITATVRVASSAKSGKNLPVTVTNDVASGGGQGTGKVLTIVAAATVKSIMPSSLKPGASKSVTITGTGFVSGATVTGPTGVKFSKVKVVSSTKITATVNVAPGAKAGKKLPVTVTNNLAGGGGRGTGRVLTIT
jgi:hypothetical protein